jgi:hypothetical protein
VTVGQKKNRKIEKEKIKKCIEGVEGEICDSTLWELGRFNVENKMNFEDLNILFVCKCSLYVVF